MLEFLNRTFEVDTYTIVVVALLAGWAGVLTMHVLSRTMLALVFDSTCIVSKIGRAHV